MVQSRLTSRAQTTIPAAVREALCLKVGDFVAYRIEEGRVIMTRAEFLVDPFAAFTEWDSPEDTEGYANL